MTDPITDAELNMSAEEWMQALAEDPSCIKTYLEAARVRGYRAGLEAAAKEYDAEDLAGVRVYCRHVAQHIRSLPVPGEAHAIRTVPMMPVDPEADARMEELRAKQPPETTRKIAAPPAEAPDLRGLLEDVRVDLEAALAELTNNLDKAGAVADVRHAIARIDVARAAQPERCTASMGFGAPEQRRCMLPTGHAGEHQSATHAWNLAAQPEGQAATACETPYRCRAGHHEGCPARAAAPGGEDAEALAIAKKLQAALKKIEAPSWPVVNGDPETACRWMQDCAAEAVKETGPALARLAARAGGSRG